MTEPAPTSSPAADPGAAPPGHPAHVPVHFHHWTGVIVAVAVTMAVVGLTVAHTVRSRQDVLAHAALIEHARQAMEQPPTVNVIHVEPGDPDSPLTLPAQCQALFETDVFGRINGYVKKWYFDIGDHVKTGDVLALIDTPELDEQIQVAQAKLESLVADIKLAQANADFARISSGRFEAGAPEGVVSQQEADLAKSQLDVALARLESAKAQRDLGKADLRRLQAMADFKRVQAPYDGVVTKRPVDIGDLVTAGSTASTTSLFTICDSHKVRVFVDVPQVARPNIHVGMDADVIAREFPDRIFHGKVDRTAEAINPSSGTLKVQVLVPNPDGALLPGTYAQVTFHCRQAHPPIRIQAGALLFLADGPHVAVLADDSSVRFRPIKIARDLGDIIEVSNGLSGNETVVLNISNEITDGEKVTPVAIKMPGAPAAEAGQASRAKGE